MQEVAGVCPICSGPAELTNASNVVVTCPRCGRFGITHDAMLELKSNPMTERQAANASGWIAEAKPALIKTYGLHQLRTLATPSVQLQLDRLLLKLRKDAPALGAPVKMDEQRRPEYVAATWALNEEELPYLIIGLQKRGLLDADSAWAFPIVSPEGHAYIDALAKNPQSPLGFCAMWFNDSVMPVWEQAIRPGIADAGYEPLRVDKHEHNQRIDEEIIALIRKSRFVVADLTGHRQGVYFEAGYAMGFGLPVVWMVREDELETTHFDTRQFNMIVWKADQLVDAKTRLQNRIEATIGKGPRTHVGA